VVGVPDLIEGEARKTYIISRVPALSVKNVINRNKQHRESFMVLKFVEFRDSLI